MDREKGTLLVSERNTRIYIVLWGFISGVLAASLVSISPLLSVFLIALSGAIFVVEKMSKGMSRETVFIMLALMSFGVGSLRYAVKDFHELEIPESTGVVVSEPEHRDTDTRFVFRADNGEKVLVSTDMYSRVEYGDRVRVEGKLKEPGIIVEEDGREFDYGTFLSKDDIYYTMSFAKVERIAEPAPVDSRSASGLFQIQIRLVSTLLGIKHSFVDTIKEILPEPESSLLAGLIVAGKQALPKSVLDDFRGAGVVHIVVLSGYNITIVAEFFLVLLAFLSLRKRAIFAGIGIVLFVCMAGANASIVRAAIMALVVLLGRVVHRGYSPERTLLLAAVLMIFMNPKILAFDPSFQLSFLAMCALIYVEPLINVWLARIALPALGREGQSRTMPSWLISLLSTTIATQLTVLPYLLYSVGSVSVTSLISNILILVFIPLTMLAGFLAALIAFVSPYLAWPLSFVSHLLLSWILGVAHVLGNLSWSIIKISHWSVWLTLILYGSFIVTVMRLRNSPRQIAS